MSTNDNAIREIEDNWGLRDTMDAIPKELHPHHNVGRWDTTLLQGLADIARRAPGEQGLSVIRPLFQRIVEQRHEPGGNDGTHLLSTEDLALVLKQLQEERFQGQEEDAADKGNAVGGENAVGNDGKGEEEHAKAAKGGAKASQQDLSSASLSSESPGDLEKRKRQEDDPGQEKGNKRSRSESGRVTRSKQANNPLNNVPKTLAPSKAPKAVAKAPATLAEPDVTEGMSTSQLARGIEKNWAVVSTREVFPNRMRPPNLPGHWNESLLKALYKLSLKTSGYYAVMAEKMKAAFDERVAKKTQANVDAGRKEPTGMKVILADLKSAETSFDGMTEKGRDEQREADRERRRQLRANGKSLLSPTAPANTKTDSGPPPGTNVQSAKADAARQADQAKQAASDREQLMTGEINRVKAKGATAATAPTSSAPPNSTNAHMQSLTTEQRTVPSVTTPAVTTPAVTTPAVTTPAVSTPAVVTPAVTTPAAATPAVATPNVSPAISQARSEVVLAEFELRAALDALHNAEHDLTIARDERDDAYITRAIEQRVQEARAAVGQAERRLGAAWQIVSASRKRLWEVTRESDV